MTYLKYLNLKKKKLLKLQLENELRLTCFMEPSKSNKY